MKASCHVMHHLKEDMVPLWMLTQNLQVNWAYSMISYMLKCQRSNSVGLPYGGMINELMLRVGIHLYYETLSYAPGKIDEKSLRLIRVHINDGNLETVPMDASDRKEK